MNQSTSLSNSGFRAAALTALLFLAVACSGGNQSDDPNAPFTMDPPCSCAEGMRRCAGGKAVQICERQDASCASWGPVVSCPGGVACESGACALNCQDLCTAGARRCADESTREVCRIGNSGCLEWVKEPCVANQYCDVAQPTGQCQDRIKCDPACPTGYSCRPNGVCAGGSPTGLIFDVKTVQLAGKITLNGAAPLRDMSCASYADTYKARVMLTEVNRGYSFSLDTLCKDSGFEVSGTVFPGTYRAVVRGGYYSNLSNLPTQGYEVESNLVITADTVGKVWDVKTVQLAGKITLNGATPIRDASCTSYADTYKARVSLVEMTKGYSFTLDTLCKDSGFDVSGPVYPGTYKVTVRGGYYSNLSNVPTQGYEAESALAISADLAGKVWDVKTVQVAGKITLNGATPIRDASCTSYADTYKGRVSLVETTKGYSFTLDTLCKDSGFDVSGPVYPGTYKVTVRGGYYSNLSNLPTQGYEAESALSIMAATAGKVWDVKTVQLSGKITLNGMTPIRDASCTSYADTYKARVNLVETTKGYSFALDTLCKDSGFDVSGPVYPGTYRVSARGGYYSNLSNVPTQSFETDSALVVTTDTAGKIFDVRTVRLSGKITLNGATPIRDTSCTSYADTYKARVALTEVKKGYSFALDTLCKDNGFDVSNVIYPGTYRVRVRGGYYSNLSNLPTPEYESEAALLVSADLAGKVWDVKTVSVDGKITLNGMAPIRDMSCSSYADTYKARVALSEPTRGYNFTLDTLCKDSGFNVRGDVYPGVYAVTVRGGYYSNLSNLPTQGFVAVTRLQIP